MKDERSKWAGSALSLFSVETGSDLPEDAPADFLCDVMHWCDRHDMSFRNELDHAYRHYRDETTKEDVPDPESYPQV